MFMFDLTFIIIYITLLHIVYFNSSVMKARNERLDIDSTSPLIIILVCLQSVEFLRRNTKVITARNFWIIA